MKYENKTHSVVTNESTVVVQKERKIKKMSLNNFFINLASDEYGTLAKHIPRQHGRLTIGCFDEIIHSGEAWE